MRFFVRLYHLLRGRSRALIAGSGLVVLACGLLAGTLVVREDITSLMPTRPQGLAEQFSVLREAPLLQGLTIAVGGADPAGSARLLADALRGPDMPRVLSGAGSSFSPSLLAGLCGRTPNLMDAEALAGLPALLSEDAMAKALRRDVDLLLAPQGIVLREFLALDPLGVCPGVWQRLAPASGAFGLNMQGGAMLSPDGSHALVLAEPVASMADSNAARHVMEKVRAAVRVLPAGTETLVLGGHRHTEENADIIQDDLKRIMPASVFLLVLAYAVFVRTVKGLYIVLLPVAALAVASACTGVLYGGISGIVLGFGSVVLGITTDYAIHVYYALRGGRETGDALERVSGPILLGAVTTLAGFAAFFSSSIPCIIQMTWFAICGVASAVFLALVVLPHCLAPNGNGDLSSSPLPGGRVCARTGMLRGLWIILGISLAVLLYDVPINGDIRALSYASGGIAHDEARMRELFGGLREQGMLAVKGSSVQDALEKNDRLWEALSRLPPEKGWDPALVTGLAPVLPSLSTQALRQEAWVRFWRERGPEVLPRLERLAAEAGFSGQAFLPFQRWIAGKPDPILPETLSEAGLDIALMMIRPAGDSSLVYSLVGAGAPSPELREVLERNDALYVSGSTFREAVDAATRADLLRFGGLSLLAILAMSAWVFRSPVRMGFTLLPVAAGLCCVLTVFRVLDMSLNIFHAMALPLIMSLSVDYGIFILAHLEGRLERESRKGVLLSGITTLSGFGVLMLARHPALFSLGLTVTLGLGAALLAALLALPCLAAPRMAEEDAHAR